MVVGCIIMYKAEDEQKAQSIFNKIINTVRYKN